MLSRTQRAGMQTAKMAALQKAEPSKETSRKSGNFSQDYQTGASHYQHSNKHTIFCITCCGGGLSEL